MSFGASYNGVMGSSRALARVALLVAATLACGSRSGARATAAEASGGPQRVCGRLASQPVVAKTWTYADIGGPSPQCDRAETAFANVPHEDRACREDVDCAAVLEPNGCSYAALTRDAALRPEYGPAPCGDPAAGMCLLATPVARCHQGCCEVGPPPSP